MQGVQDISVLLLQKCKNFHFGYTCIWGVFNDIFENIRALAFTSENLL